LKWRSEGTTNNSNKLHETVKVRGERFLIFINLLFYLYQRVVRLIVLLHYLNHHHIFLLHTIHTMRFDPLSLLLVSVGAWQACHGFMSNTQHTNSIGSRRTFVSTSKRHILFDDFEDFRPSEDDKTNKKKDDESDLYAALRARQADFKTSSSSFVNIDDYNSAQEGYKEDSVLDGVREDEQYCLNNWGDASCTSTVRLTLDDWIRRIAIDTYPLVVCGTASGHLYLADLQEGEELDCIMNVHVDRTEFFEAVGLEPPAQMQEAISDLYGMYDGGGVMALAMKDDWIVSSGREGGVHLCRITGQEKDVYKGSRGGTSRQTKLSLQRLGKFRGLQGEDDASNVIVTSLEFDSTGTLWCAGYDGVLRGFDYDERDDEDNPTMLKQIKPTAQVDLGSPIVNLSINNELGCGVASTVTDGLVIFALEDGEILARWNPLVKKVRKEFVRSAILLKDDSNADGDDLPAWSVICGGSRGSLFQRKLNVDRTGFLSESRPFLDQKSDDEATFPIKMRPNHLGPVVALASPAPGLLVSGALDGSMRVWDYSTNSNAQATDEDDGDEDVEEEDDDGDDDVIEFEAQYDDVQQSDSRPRCLYALSGYKVWLGSIFASSRKLVSDGADNTIIVHSFENEEEVLFSEDDDEDDIEGFSFE
jgi:WD40 repeat protein